MGKSFRILGKKLKQAREKAFLTQDQLGALMDVTGDNIGRIEQSDVAGMYWAKLPKLAAALKMTEDQVREQLGVPAGYVPKPAKPKLARLPLSPEAFAEAQRLAQLEGSDVAAFVERLILDRSPYQQVDVNRRKAANTPPVHDKGAGNEPKGPKKPTA